MGRKGEQHALEKWLLNPGSDPRELGPAFTQLEPLLRCWADRICRPSTDDVLQDVFVKFLEAKWKYRKGDFLAWIKRVVVHRALNNVKMQTRRTQREAKAGGHRTEIQCDGTECQIDGAHEDLVASVMVDLDETDREIVVMHYHKGKSLCQIADELSLGAARVYQRHSRLKSKIRKLLADRS